MDRALLCECIRTNDTGPKDDGFVSNSSEEKKQTRFKNISLFGCLLFRHGARYTRGTDFQREDPNNAKTLFPEYQNIYISFKNYIFFFFFFFFYIPTQSYGLLHSLLLSSTYPSGPLA